MNLKNRAIRFVPKRAYFILKELSVKGSKSSCELIDSLGHDFSSDSNLRSAISMLHLAGWIYRRHNEYGQPWALKDPTVINTILLYIEECDFFGTSEKECCMLNIMHKYVSKYPDCVNFWMRASLFDKLDLDNVRRRDSESNIKMFDRCKDTNTGRNMIQANHTTSTYLSRWVTISELAETAGFKHINAFVNKKTSMDKSDLYHLSLKIAVTLRELLKGPLTAGELLDKIANGEIPEFSQGLTYGELATFRNLLSQLSLAGIVLRKGGRRSTVYSLANGLMISRVIRLLESINYRGTNLKNGNRIRHCLQFMRDISPANIPYVHNGDDNGWNWILKSLHTSLPVSERRYLEFKVLKDGTYEWKLTKGAIADVVVWKEITRLFKGYPPLSGVTQQLLYGEKKGM